MPTHAAVASGLEGLVGGFLMGHDFRRQRTLDREQAGDRQRARDRQTRLDTEASETLRRSRLVEDVELREEHGLAFDTGERVGALRQGVAEHLMSIPDGPHGPAHPCATCHRAPASRSGAGAIARSGFLGFRNFWKLATADSGEAPRC